MLHFTCEQSRRYARVKVALNDACSLGRGAGSQAYATLAPQVRQHGPRIQGRFPIGSLLHFFRMSFGHYQITLHLLSISRVCSIGHQEPLSRSTNVQLRLCLVLYRKCISSACRSIPSVSHMQDRSLKPDHLQACTYSEGCSRTSIIKPDSQPDNKTANRWSTI